MSFLIGLRSYSFLLPLFAQTYLLHPSFNVKHQSSSSSSRSSSSSSSSSVDVLYHHWSLIIRAGILMPLTLYLCLSEFQNRLFKPIEDHFHMNFTLISFVTFHLVCVSIEFGLFQGSVFKIEKKDKDDDDDDKKVGQLDQQDHLLSKKHHGNTKKRCDDHATVIDKIKFTIWLLSSPRGLGTSWAPPPSVTPLAPIRSPQKFIFITLLKAIASHFAFTILWTLGVRYIQDPRGPAGYINQWTSQLLQFSIPQNCDFLMSFFLPAAFGGAAWFAIDTLGCILNLIECLIYLIEPYILPRKTTTSTTTNTDTTLRHGHSTTSHTHKTQFDSRLYPSLFNQIWLRQNITDFWSKGWHSLFRRHIVFLGWNPIKFVFTPIFGKRVGQGFATIGAMAFSGAFHEYVVASSSTHVDPTMPTFSLFLLCGVAMVLEEIYERHTGKKITGLGGLCWMGLVFFVPGRSMVNSWIASGLGVSGIPVIQQWGWPRFLIPFGGFLPETWLQRWFGEGYHQRPEFIDWILRFTKII